MPTSDPPVSLDCIGCSTRNGWRTAVRVARWAVPIILGVLVALGGGYASLHFMARANASEVTHLREGRTDDREEIRRLASEAREAERERAAYLQAEAERWRTVSAALARIEARLDTMERRTSSRRRPQ